MTIRTCAIRGRSDGEWHLSDHSQRLEVGGDIANSITSVSKDSLILIVYERNEIQDSKRR